MNEIIPGNIGTFLPYVQRKQAILFEYLFFLMLLEEKRVYIYLVNFFGFDNCLLILTRIVIKC